MTKPFGMQEPHARIRVALRRTKREVGYRLEEPVA
jgi:DNA-binding response OmpR family regulator